jgi:membrane associated rhomboid family serine protease
MSEQEYRPGSFQILPPVVKNLLIINGIFFMATIVFGSSLNINLYDWLGFSHIFMNMFALWMFGGVLENYWGPKKFLIFYIVTALGAGATHMGYTGYKLYPAYTYEASPSVENMMAFADRNKSILNYPAFLELRDAWIANPDNPEYKALADLYVSKIKTVVSNEPVVGASGAVFGLLMAFGMLFPNSLIYIYFLFPIKAKYFVIIFGLIELFSGFAEVSGDNVAHFAHLGGMVFGFFLLKWWQKRKFRY